MIMQVWAPGSQQCDEYLPAFNFELFVIPPPLALAYGNINYANV